MFVPFAQDLRYALRSLRRQPGHTAVAVLTLALGIGASTAIFSLVNAIVLRPLPFRDPGTLFTAATRRATDTNRPFTIPDFMDYREQNHTLEGLAAYGTWSANLTGAAEPERLQGMKISANAFDLLGVRPQAGRTLHAADDTPGRQRVVVLSDRFWRRHFGADRGCVGGSLTLNGELWTIVGVLPADFVSPVRGAEIVVPLAPDADPRRHIRSSVNFLRGIARTRQGVSRERGEADLTAIQQRLRVLDPQSEGPKLGLVLTPLTESTVGSFRVELLTLLGSVGVLLLIACVNLANLALMRGAARRHEFAVRTAIGASRGRLVRLLVAESLLLATAGGVGGVGLALAGIPLLLKFSPQNLPRTGEVGVDLPVLGFAFAISALSAVIFGLAPAWAATRVDVQGELKEDGRAATGGPRRDRARRLLVVGETALSVLLLVSAALLVRSYAHAAAVAPGFEPRHVLSVRLSLPATRYPDRAALFRFHDALRTRLEELPGAEAVGSISVLPLSGLLSACDFTIDGRDVPPDVSTNTHYRIADDGYFRAMQIPVVTGRDFDGRDRADSPPVTVIGRTFAERFWPGASPIGAHVRIDDNLGPPRPVEIVGVVGDVRHLGLDADAELMLYVPEAQLHLDQVTQYGASQFWLVRTRGVPDRLAAGVRAAIHAVDPDVPAASLQGMEEYVSASVAPRRFNMRLLGAFAVAALLLAGLGLYGVLASGVAQQRHEMAIRSALGAQPHDIVRLVLGWGLRLSTLGVALGLGAAFVFTRLITSLLFGVSATDPLIFAAIAVAQMLVAMLACWVPARRAMRVDPLVALR